MTLKRQFNALIAAIVLVPLLCALFFPVYHYFSSPKRMLVDKWNGARRDGETRLSEGDWKNLERHLLRLPPDIECAVMIPQASGGEGAALVALASTIPEFKAGREITKEEIWRAIEGTSGAWFYQISTHRLRDADGKALILTRGERGKKQRGRFNAAFALNMAAIAVFVAALIVVIMNLSRAILTPISDLERNARSIAAGDLSAPLAEGDDGKGESNEITSLAESLEKMRRALLEAQERRMRFVMGMSHDIRTPIAVIKGYNEALIDGVASSPEETRSALDIIARKTAQLEGMVDSLIAFARLDSGDWRQNLAMENLFAALDDFAREAETTGALFGRKVSRSVGISRDAEIPMDRQLFVRALENLLGNAIRYSREGDSIRVSGEESAESYLVSVSDTGSGIAEEDLPRVFEMFYRGEPSRNGEGMGIGLAVVKSIVDTHGWSIGVKSKKGEGTSFIITIPKRCRA